MSDKEDLVRMLLAKAESSTFEAEKESFRAAAEKLIIKHKLDRDSILKEEEQDLGIGSRHILFEEFASKKWFKDIAAEMSSGVINALGYQGVWFRSRRPGGDTGAIYADESVLDMVEDLVLHLAGACYAACDEWWKIERSYRGTVPASERTYAKRSFCNMWYAKVSQRISAERIAAEEEQREHGALVLSSERYKNFALDANGIGKFSSGPKRRVSDNLAAHAGFSAGDKADIHGKKRI